MLLKTTSNCFRKHFYVGSANFDVEDLNKMKEVGLMITNCPKLADDASRLFAVYVQLGEAQQIPQRFDVSEIS